jgi:hypothetical protein
MTESPRSQRDFACPKCRKPGYGMDAAADGRPRFTCRQCGHVWTCGHDGRAKSGQREGKGMSLEDDADAVIKAWQHAIQDSLAEAVILSDGDLSGLYINAGTHTIEIQLKLFMDKTPQEQFKIRCRAHKFASRMIAILEKD